VKQARPSLQGEKEKVVQPKVGDLKQRGCAPEKRGNGSSGKMSSNVIKKAK